MILSFLYKCVRVFCEYFENLEEESIRDNFVIVYELLDELMDFGYPQSTDSKILQEYITQEGHRIEQVRPPPALTNRVNWRSEGIKYRRNEVFLDVIESVHFLVRRFFLLARADSSLKISSTGTVLRSEINGVVRMRVYLSGMPELRLGLNDKVLFESSGVKNRGVELEDVKFDQCVRLSRFENDRTISFVPPDGEFDLMTYRLQTQVSSRFDRQTFSRSLRKVKPLFLVESAVEKYSHSRVEYMIKAKSQFKRRSTANNVQIIVPVPSDADSGQFKATVGTVKYAPEQNAMIWTIKSFPVGRTRWGFLRRTFARDFDRSREAKSF